MSRRKKVLKKMQQLHVTQKQLAQYTMLSCDSIDLWLDVKIVIPYNKLLRILHLLDLDAEDIVKIK